MLDTHNTNIYFYKKLKLEKNEVLSKLNFYSELNSKCKLNINYLLLSDKLNDNNKIKLKTYINTFFDTSIKINQGNKILNDIIFYIHILEQRPFVKEDGQLFYERLL